jgi:hypothetical protein
MGKYSGRLLPPSVLKEYLNGLGEINPKGINRTAEIV